jgi:hypothetical protein
MTVDQLFGRLTRVLICFVFPFCLASQERNKEKNILKK